jgi:hypothetical protein
MLGVSRKGIAMHRCLQGDNDTSGIGVCNVYGGNDSDRFYRILNGSWKWKMKQFLVAEWERVPTETKTEKWIEYE